MSTLWLLFVFFLRTCAWEALPVPFPPDIDMPDSDGRVGHLKPFGQQRAPEKPVEEYTTVMRPPEFWEQHVRDRIPAVFRGAVAHSPAHRLWTDEYLEKNYGDQYDVLYELRDEDRSKRARRMSMRRFLAEYRQHDRPIYAVTILPEAMRKELPALPCLLCGTFRRSLQEANFWLGYGGTRSVIHFDADHNIHCLVAGRKDFMMIHPRFADKLHLAPREPNQGSGYSTINPDVVNLDEYPSVSDVEWEWATLAPGDCIFIPARYLHQVRSYGRSISSTVLFFPYNEFNETGCENETFGYTDLSQVELVWTYKGGDAVIDLGYLNPELIRINLRSLLNEDGIVTWTHFFRMYAQSQDGQLEEVRAQFDRLDIHNRGHLLKEDIENLPLEALKTVAREMDSKPYDEDEDENEDKDEHDEL